MLPIAFSRPPPPFAFGLGRSRCPPPFAAGTFAVAAIAGLPPFAAAWPVADVAPFTGSAGAWPVAARLQHLLAVVAAEIHPRLRVVARCTALAEFLSDVGVVVTHAVAMIGIVLPVVDVGIVDVDRAVDVDVVAAPIHAAAPITTACGPCADGDASGECDAGRDGSARVVADGRGPVVRRIGRIRPRAVDNRRVVVRHVDRIRLGRFDDDNLLVLLGLDRNLLLLGRGEFVLRLRAGAQPLDGVHHVGLLREHGVAELLRPVELAAHHVEDRRRRGQRLHAVVPALLVGSGFELIALQRLVVLGPAIGLHDLERIGRGHQHFRQQGVGIKRDRGDELVKLLGLQRRGRRLCRLVLRVGDRREHHEESGQKQPYEMRGHDRRLSSCRVSAECELMRKLAVSLGRGRAGNRLDRGPIALRGRGYLWNGWITLQSRFISQY